MEKASVIDMRQIIGLSVGWLWKLRRRMTYLNTKEWGEDNIWEYDQVDFIEKASGHENDKNEVHDGEHAQRHPLHYGVSIREDVVDHNHRDCDGDEEGEDGGHVVLVHSEKVSLV